MKQLLITMMIAVTAAFVAIPDARAHEDDAPPAQPFASDLTPGYVLVEGDIQVPYDQYLRMTSGLIQAAGAFGPVTRWPGNVVPFDFVTTGAGAVSAANQTAAINAMNAIAARAGLAFRAATGFDPNRIRFQASTGNNSPVGMQGGAQIINIVSWNSEIIICHEIYHSLGFWHEQSRSDRNTFVTVNLGNVCAGMENNFDLVGASTAYGPYDFDSFMHYGRMDFSCTGFDTITVNAPWNADWQNRIGQRDHFSYYDRINCRAWYPFANDRWLDRNHFGLPFGTFTDPFQSPNLADTVAAVPSGGTLFVKFGANYRGVGTHTKPITLVAPVGNATFGN